MSKWAIATVANLDSAISEAEELGGSVVMPPTDNGWVTKAQVADPAGNVLTLIQQSRRPPGLRPER